MNSNISEIRIGQNTLSDIVSSQIDDDDSEDDLTQFDSKCSSVTSNHECIEYSIVSMKCAKSINKQVCESMVKSIDPLLGGVTTSAISSEESLSASITKLVVPTVTKYVEVAVKEYICDNSHICNIIRAKKTKESNAENEFRKATQQTSQCFDKALNLKYSLERRSVGQPSVETLDSSSKHYSCVNSSSVTSEFDISRKDTCTIVGAIAEDLAYTSMVSIHNIENQSKDKTHTGEELESPDSNSQLESDQNNYNLHSTPKQSQKVSNHKQT